MGSLYQVFLGVPLHPQEQPVVVGELQGLHHALLGAGGDDQPHPEGGDALVVAGDLDRRASIDAARVPALVDGHLVGVVAVVGQLAGARCDLSPRTVPVSRRCMRHCAASWAPSGRA